MSVGFILNKNEKKLHIVDSQIPIQMKSNNILSVQKESYVKGKPIILTGFIKHTMIPKD